MVSFDDPTEIARDYTAAVKLWHVVDGLFIWEFFTTLDYEWSVFRGRHPYRWTIWLYSITRLGCFLAVILNLVGMNTTSGTRINCQGWFTSKFLFAYIALAGGSLLIVLRVIAIWNRNKVVSAIASSMWLINLGVLIQGISRVHSVWSPANAMCLELNIESNTLTIVTLLVTDFVLLVSMLVGLLRLRQGSSGTFDLGRLLWKQGVIWLALATIADVTPSVIMLLNLNDVFNAMFLMPSLITMTLAATRMYRSLAHFTNAGDPIWDSNPPSYRTGSGSGSNNPNNPVVNIPAKKLHVAVASTFEEFPMHQRGTCVSSSTLGTKIHDKALEHGSDDDIERGVEKP